MRKKDASWVKACFRVCGNPARRRRGREPAGRPEAGNFRSGCFFSACAPGIIGRFPLRTHEPLRVRGRFRTHGTRRRCLGLSGKQKIGDAGNGIGGRGGILFRPRRGGWPEENPNGIPSISPALREVLCRVDACEKKKNPEAGSVPGRFGRRRHDAPSSRLMNSNHGYPGWRLRRDPGLMDGIPLGFGESPFVTLRPTMFIAPRPPRLRGFFPRGCDRAVRVRNRGGSAHRGAVPERRAR